MVIQKVQKTGWHLIIDIMPEDEKDEIIARGDRATDDRWFLGDIANRWIERVEAGEFPKLPYGKPVCNVMDVYPAVAYLYGENVSARTIRYYAEIARFYSPGTRAKYDVLSFKHFETAMRWGRESWQKGLDACLNYMDSHAGRRPSANWLELYLNGKLDQIIPENFINELPPPDESLVRVTDDILAYDRMVADATGRDVDAETLISFSQAVLKLEGLIERIPTSGYQRNRLRVALDNLNGIITDILKGS